MKILYIIFSLAYLLGSCKPTTKPVSSKIDAKAPSYLFTGDSTVFPYHVAMKNTNGKVLYSNETIVQKDKPTVLLFWLTTCGPCARELNSIKSNFDQWQNESPFHVVAISEDWEENYPAFVDRVTREVWPFNAYWDGERNFKKLMPGNLNGLPQTFIFDKKGKLTFSKKGFLPGEEKIIFEKIKEASKS